MPEGLTVEQLHVSHRRPAGAPRPVLSGIDVAVAPGEFVALVGASGSGKTMTAMSVLGLLPPQMHHDSGSVRLGGTDLSRAGEAELNGVRGGRIGMLYQQPKRMFNPRRTVLDHLREPLRLHGGLRGGAARQRALELLSEVGFRDPESCARAHPHQLSGGMAQRAMVALALAGRPELLLADEPTSALDTVLERQILELLDRERRDRGLGVLYISHNLATVSAYADRVVVLDAGRVVEAGPAGAVLNRPRSACTRALLEAAALTPADTPPPAAGTGAALALERVTKTFGTGRRRGRPALEEITLELRDREILGVLGQSGSGKSTLARLVVGLETPDAGRVTRAPGAAPGAGPASTAVQLVFQEPHDSFDPRMRLRTSLEAPLRQHRDLSADEREARLLDVVREVELDPELLERYPGQCSGGQLQRLTIARALLLEPSVLICDEATSALDAATQRTVLDLLLRLHRDRPLSLIMISHDLGVIRYMSHRVAVLHRGALVELAPTREFFAAPRHEHSRKLVAAALPRECAILDRHTLPPEHRDVPA
ncbi:ATP-binding cassette domain-containing protein [Kocuria sediminis]|uniref:ATP-binding cassette domain-containing protein n=1 Tax=Kocuria sediminis TaxID=1038857 RepID=A0A6N8GKK7_9MICC|nr:ABC transporter ATP-binding protein [Kocuria sediminis]MUN63279.1 ATP-binding cassette domain-containing protein [Kocuria sediminis]